MVVIKDMEMPKNCYDCPMHIINCHKHGGGSFCTITGDDTDCHWNRERRADNCPLTVIITCKDCNNHGIDSQNHLDIDGARYCSTLHTYTGYYFYCGDAERRE